jgi:hypothetical protein
VSDADLDGPELVVGAWRGYRVWRIRGDRLTGWWHTSYVRELGGELRRQALDPQGPVPPSPGPCRPPARLRLRAVRP